MHFTSWSCWLRIVSIAIAVLPVERSPMISSRWPRPTFVIESIALIPVWSGSFTGWRAITPGAFHSTGRVSDDSTGPCPSIGLPSGSTTRPSSPGPTGTDATLPVRRTGSPSFTCCHSPKSAAPTLSSSRLNARPTTPCSNSSRSSETAFSRPWTRAMPSPTWSTEPTSARSVWTSYSSIRLLRIDVISSGRSFKALSCDWVVASLVCARGQFVAELLEPAAHARVDAQRAGLQDDPADQVRVDAARRLDRAPRRLLDLPRDRRGLVVRQLIRGRQLDRQALLRLRDEQVELALDLLDLARAALLRHEQDEVPDEVVGAAEDLAEHGRLLLRVELGVLEHAAQLRHRADRRREITELLVDDVELAVLLRRLEERAR